MDQHYDKKINDEYELILRTIPHHNLLREKLVDRIVEYLEDRNKPLSILEFGSGRGETLIILLSKLKEKNLLDKVEITSIDYDKEVLVKQEEAISSNFNVAIKFIPIDIFEYLKNASEKSFDVCTATWTLHNFPEAERKILLTSLYTILKKDGLLAIMDKYVPDDPKLEYQLFMNQITEFTKLPLKKENLSALLEHEHKDRSPEYIMKRQDSLEEISEIGFKNPVYVTSTRRDSVLIATV